MSKRFGLYETIALIFIILACIALASFFMDAQNVVSQLQEEKYLQELSDKRSDEMEESSISDIQEITIAELVKDTDAYRIIDVREDEEWDQGHARSAVHIRLGDIVSDVDVQNNIIELARSGTLVFFCHDGDRSRMAVDVLRERVKGDMLVIDDSFKQMRKIDEKIEPFWEGSLKRVLPEDFDTYDTDRLDDENDIDPDVMIDVSVDGGSEMVIKEGGIVRAPVALMSSDQVVELLNFMSNKSIGVICDSKVSCFYAKILSYRHQKGGGVFDGYVRSSAE